MCALVLPIRLVRPHGLTRPHRRPGSYHIHNVLSTSDGRLVRLFRRPLRFAQLCTHFVRTTVSRRRAIRLVATFWPWGLVEVGLGVGPMGCAVFFDSCRRSYVRHRLPLDRRVSQHRGTLLRPPRRSLGLRARCIRHWRRRLARLVYRSGRPIRLAVHRCVYAAQYLSFNDSFNSVACSKYHECPRSVALSAWSLS